MARRQLRPEQYTVGWVCALPIELAAAQEMLDEEHEDLKHDEQDNIYSLGRIGEHNIAVVCLPAGLIGSNPAAAVATQMRATFKSIRFCLMVGIGGGVPSSEDIRLGDVVVSQPHQGYGGVIQYDFGKATPSGFQRTGFLNSPPVILLSAIANMRANQLRRKTKFTEHISKLCHIPEFTREAAGPDILFEAMYNHVLGPTCKSCSSDKQVDRQPRSSSDPVIHYGTIASGNQVIKDATERDTVSQEFGGVLCFEMEAAGLMNTFPCLVIRGICDYTDSHKNKMWQPYAAGTAAACATELLSVIPSTDVTKAFTVDDILNESCEPSVGPPDHIPLRREVASHHTIALRNKPDGNTQAREALTGRSQVRREYTESSQSDVESYVKVNGMPMLDQQTLERLLDELNKMKQQATPFSLDTLHSNESQPRLPHLLTKLRADQTRIDPGLLDQSTISKVSRMTNLPSTRSTRSIDTLAASTELINQDSQQYIHKILRGMTLRDLETWFCRFMAIVAGFGSMLQRNIRALSPSLIHAFLVLKLMLPPMIAMMQSISIRSPLKLNIIFEDVLGRQHGLDFHYFRDWNTFKSMLEGQFRDCPGEEEVIKGDYRLMNTQRYDSILSAENWANSVGPGTKIVMSILAKQLRRIKGNCPRKDCQGTLDPVEENRSICTTCKIEISYSPDTPRLAELPDDDDDIHTNKYQSNDPRITSVEENFAERVGPEVFIFRAGGQRQSVPQHVDRKFTSTPKSRLKAVRNLKEKISRVAEQTLQEEFVKLPPVQNQQTKNELHLFRRVYTSDLEAFPKLSDEPYLKVRVPSTHKENDEGQDDHHDHTRDQRAINVQSKPRRSNSMSKAKSTPSSLVDTLGWRGSGRIRWRPIGQPGLGLLKIVEFEY